MGQWGGVYPVRSSWGGVPWLGGYPVRYPPGGYLTGYPPRGYLTGYPLGGYLTGYPPGGYLTGYPPGGVPDRVPPRGVPDRVPPPGVPDWVPPGGYLTGYPGGGTWLGTPWGGTWLGTPLGGNLVMYPPRPGQDGGGTLLRGDPGRTTEGVLTTRRAVCLLRSRRRTFLFKNILIHWHFPLVSCFWCLAIRCHSCNVRLKANSHWETAGMF